MMCAPFCKLGGVGPSSLDSTPGAPGTMSRVMGTVSALFTLNTIGTCCDAASSIGIWTLTWPLLKKYSGALNAPICAKVLLKSVGSGRMPVLPAEAAKPVPKTSAMTPGESDPPTTGFRLFSVPPGASEGGGVWFSAMPPKSFAVAGCKELAVALSVTTICGVTPLGCQLAE